MIDWGKCNCAICSGEPMLEPLYADDDEEDIADMLFDEDGFVASIE